MLRPEKHLRVSTTVDPDRVVASRSDLTEGEYRFTLSGLLLATTREQWDWLYRAGVAAMDEADLRKQRLDKVLPVQAPKGGAA